MSPLYRFDDIFEALYCYSVYIPSINAFKGELRANKRVIWALGLLILSYTK